MKKETRGAILTAALASLLGSDMPTSTPRQRKPKATRSLTKKQRKRKSRRQMEKATRKAQRR